MARKKAQLCHDIAREMRVLEGAENMLHAMPPKNKSARSELEIHRDLCKSRIEVRHVDMWRLSHASLTHTTNNKTLRDELQRLNGSVHNAVRRRW